MKTKIVMILSFIVVLFGIFPQNYSFGTCVSDTDQILYRDGVSDTYRRFDRKVTDYIDSIIEDNTSFNTSTWKWIEPEVTINECTSKKFYKIYSKYDDVELVDKDEEIYNAYETLSTPAGDTKIVIFSGYMYNYTGNIYNFSGDTYMYIPGENYNGEENIFNNGSGYIYSGETNYFVTCEDTVYKLNDLYYYVDRKIVTPDFTYKNGRDYVLANLCTILKSYNSNYNCNNLFSDIDKNILSYNKGNETFKIKEVSYGYDTSDFATRDISIDYRKYLTFFRLTSSNDGDRVFLNSDMTELSASSLIAGDALSITGGVNLQLPYQGCDDVRYNYKIYYQRDNEQDADGNPVFHLITEDRFAITSGGVLYGIDEDGNLVNKDNYFYIPEDNRYFVNMTWDDYWKKAVVTINESIYLTKKGNYKFFLLIDGELLSQPKAIALNLVSIPVVPTIPSVNTSVIKLSGYDESVSYYPLDTMDVLLYLKDKFGNEIYDVDQGINLSYYTDGSSIQFETKSGWKDDKITGLVSLGDPNVGTYFSAKLRFMDPGLYPMTFKVNVPNKNSEDEYDGTSTTISLSVIDNGATQKVYIEDPSSATSDFSISCTNDKIVLKYICKLDNFSGCNPYANSSLTFDSESDNGKTGFLSIKDYAGNYKQKYYSIEHIDKTAPSILLGLAGQSDFVTESSRTILATDAALHLKINDYRPSGCSKTKQIKVLVNGVQKYFGNVDENEINVLEGLFEKKGDYNIRVYVTDAAGNTGTINKTIKVISNNGYSYEFLGLYNTGYADANDVMTFKFKIIDSFGNLVERDDILDTVRLTSDLDNKEISPDVVDSLTVKDYSLNNGILSINAVLYNKSKNNIRLGGFIKLKEVTPTNTSPYYDLETYILPVNINSTLNISNVGNIFTKGIFTGEELTINEAGTMSFTIPLNNCGKNDIVSDIKVKANFTFVDAFTNQEIESMYIKGATGYEDLVEDLQNGGLDIPGTFSCGNELTRTFEGLFTSTDGVPSPKVKLSVQFEVYYNLDGLAGEKEIEKIVGSDSELTINYWGVLVKGLFTNSSKGLYELLRKGDINMGKSASSLASQGVAFNKILGKLAVQVKGYDYLSQNNIYGEISGVNKYNHDLHIGSSTIKGKSLIYVKGGNIYIDGNIRKNDANSILTIAAIKDKEGNGGKIIIDPSVTNVDAILITNGGIYSYDNVTDLYSAINGNKNTELNNQLVINGLIVSKKNTIGGSIAMNNKYVLPGGKEIDISSLNYYRAALFDLNFLRKYHYLKNRGNTAEDPTTGAPLNDVEYGTNPVIIMYDSSIKTSKPYGF